MLMPNYEELVDLKNKTQGPFVKPDQKARSSLNGQHASLFKGRGLDFSEYREYQNGDDIRSIDWRVTARTGRPHTKVFTEERERSVFIIVDVNRYMQFGTKKTFKSIQAARVAALIAWRAHELNDKVGAILFGNFPEKMKFLAAKKSRRPIWEMLRLLCTDHQCEQEVNLEEALTLADQRIPRGSSVFMISDFYEVSKGFEIRLGLLSKKCDVTLIKVSDPVDMEIPNVKSVSFWDEMGKKIDVDTDESNGRFEYRKIWKKNDTSLVNAVFLTRVKLIRVSTDRDVLDELFRRDHETET
jgi:uncharacterized protein (DUF58 family)